MNLTDREREGKVISKSVKDGVVAIAREHGTSGNVYAFQTGYLLSMIGYMALDIPGVAEYLAERGLITDECPVDYEREVS